MSQNKISGDNSGNSIGGIIKSFMGEVCERTNQGCRFVIGITLIFAVTTVAVLKVTAGPAKE